MEKGIKGIYRLFAVLVIFFMIWAMASTIFSPRIGAIFSLFRDSYSPKVTIVVNIFCLFFAFLLFFILKNLLKKIKIDWDLSDKLLFYIFGLELVIYAVSLFLFIRFIGFHQPVDDTAITLKFLEQLKAGENWGYNYMYSNPQNLLLMYIFRGIQFFFGTNYYPIIAVFCGIHLITIIFLFLSLRNLKVSNFATLITIQIMLFAFQITLHVPVAYTDILSLFFGSATFFFITKYVNKKKQYVNRNIIYVLLATATSTIGFISKGTGLILILAMILFFAFYHTGKWRLLAFLPLVFLVLGNFGWKQFIDVQKLYPNSHYGQPNTHYLMMGLNNTPIPDNLSGDDKYRWVVGAYSSADQRFTWDMFLDKKMPKKEVEEKHLSIIKERLNAMDFKQFLAAINNKVAVTWSSGDLKSSFEIFLGTGKNEKNMWVFRSKTSGLILYAVMMVIQYLVYLGIIFTSIKFFKNINPLVFLSNIYISGYFAFLLIWESSPRYAMGIFVPAIIMIGLLIEKEKTKRIS